MHATQEQPSEDPNEYANLLKEYIWDAMDARVEEQVAERVAEAKVIAEALADARADARIEAEVNALAALRDRSLAALRDQANILVHQLDSRGFRLDPDTITRIYGCQDSSQLELWQARVRTATSLAEVFAP